MAGNPGDNTIFYQQPEYMTPGAATVGAISATLIANATAIDDPTANSDGIQLYPFGKNLSIEVTGSGTFSLQLYGSNADSMPTTDSGWSTLGTAISAFGITFASYPVRFIQARLASISGGSASVNCNIHSVAP